MKKINIFILLLTTVLLSCKKDFLSNVNQNEVLTREDYVADLNTTRQYLNGEVYSTMAGQIASGMVPLYADLVADNVKPTTGSSNLLQLYSWNQRPGETGTILLANNSNCNGVSLSAYKIIRGANFVAEKSAQFTSENPALADELRGQALALRGYLHFVLLNFFAQQFNFTADGSHPGVAYVTSSNWTNDPGKRKSVAECYALIIQDLNQSLSLQPIKPLNKAYVGRTAVQAMLARVYLSKGDFANAKKYATAVVKAVPLMKVNYPAAMFTNEDTEAILQFQPSDFTTWNYSTFFPGVLLRGNVRYKATNDLADLINQNPNDKRRAWLTASAGTWNITKFPIGVNPAVAGNGSYNQTLIRSSEMSFIAAESYAQLNMIDSARFHLDEIRLRADATLLPTTSSGATLLNAIYTERRKELAFEGFRMFDLLRWKIPVIRTDFNAPAPSVLPYPSDKAIAPLPLLDVNIYGLTQNPSY